MSISKDTELLAEMLANLAVLIAGLYTKEEEGAWADGVVRNMHMDILRAKADE